MPRLRALFFWAHLACGVVAGLVILMMCVTGVVLTYQRQIQYWADTRHYRAEPPAQASRAPVERLVSAARAAAPEAEPGPVTFRSDPALPVSVAMGPRTIYLNPYTAEVYGEPTGGRVRAFMTSMVSWHRYVAMSGERRPMGKAITGAANLIFLFIVISGAYLWWPKSLTWTQIRQITWFRRGLPGKARDFNWHNTIGFWSALPLAIVVFGAVPISYTWASNALYRAVGLQHSSAEVQRPTLSGPTPDGVNADRLFAQAMSFQPDWQILSARIPASATAPVVFTIDRGDGGQPQLRGTLTLNPRNGDVERWDGFDAMSTGRQLRSFLRFAHTGEYFGLTGQTIAGLVSAGGALLTYTGVALALRRFLGWCARRRRAPAPNVVRESTRARSRIGAASDATE